MSLYRGYFVVNGLDPSGSDVLLRGIGHEKYWKGFEEFTPDWQASFSLRFQFYTKERLSWYVLSKVKIERFWIDDNCKICSGTFEFQEWFLLSPKFHPKGEHSEWLTHSGSTDTFEIDDNGDIRNTGRKGFVDVHSIDHRHKNLCFLSEKRTLEYGFAKGPKLHLNHVTGEGHWGMANTDQWRVTKGSADCEPVIFYQPEKYVTKNNVEFMGETRMKSFRYTFSRGDGCCCSKVGMVDRISIK